MLWEIDNSKLFQDVGKPNFIDYESYIKKDFAPLNEKEKNLLKYLTTTYFINK